MAINGQSVLAVIPARGGSKRVPRKNLREYRGQSLLGSAIAHSLSSKYIDWTLVSTDDPEMDMVARSFFAMVINRPSELATDMASSEDVLRHALKCRFPPYKGEDITPSRIDWIVLLQPTSPLRTAEDIDACIERAQMGDGCISVGPEGFTNGAVYVARREWIEKHDFSHLGLMKYRMPEERSLDIDTEGDFLK